MSISVVQRANGKAYLTVGTLSVAFTSNVTAGNSLLALISCAKPVSSVTDSLGQTWVRDGIMTGATGSNSVSAWRLSNSQGGACTVTATQSSSGTRPILMAIIEVNANLAATGAWGATGTSAAPSVTIPNLPVGVESLACALLDAGSSYTTFTARPAGWNLEASCTGIPEGPVGDLLDQGTIWSAPTTTATWGLNLARTWTAMIANWIAVVATPPGIPTIGPPAGPILLPGLPQIPGFPWFAGFTQQPGLPSAPAAVTAPVQPFLIPAIPDTSDDDRLRLALDQLGSILNSLIRQQQLFRPAAADFGVRGRGFSQGRAPGVSDDLTTGAGPGTPWIDTSGDSPKLWVCADASAGAAAWLQLRTVDMSSTAPQGLTGVLP